MPLPDPIFASNGRAARIVGPPGSQIGVHIDSILRINRGSEWTRTTTGLERGASLTVHRQRVPETVTMEILVTDIEPVIGVGFTPLWERDHAVKTKARLVAAQASENELRVWTGVEFLRTPAGVQVWVLDNINDTLEAPEVGVLRATLTFGESPRFATSFTPALDSVAPELTDVAGDTADRGRQSTTSVGTVVGSWP